MNPNSSANFVAEIGARIREARRKNGLTQAEVAKSSGLNRSFLGAMERGARNFSLETLFEVAKALKVEAQSLVPPGMPAPRKG
jgi:transcriptional regulator with XRE-family HTH domain